MTEAETKASVIEILKAACDEIAGGDPPASGEALALRLADRFSPDRMQQFLNLSVFALATMLTVGDVLAVLKEE